MKKLSLALVGILLALHVFAAENPLTNQDVVKLVKLGLGDDAVIAKVRQAPAVDFKLETDDLGNLKTAGVSGKVIAAMLDRVSGAATGEVVTPEAAHALAASRSGPASGAWAGTLEAKDGKKTLTMHMGQFHQTEEITSIVQNLCFWTFFVHDTIILGRLDLREGKDI